jgi:hypothetical protein
VIGLCEEQFCNARSKNREYGNEIAQPRILAHARKGAMALTGKAMLTG